MLDFAKKIRMSQHDLQAIVDLFHKHFLKNDKLWIFGSRTDLSKKGGDIDLYIETNVKTVNDAIEFRANFIWELEHKIGEQKIDIVLNITSLKNDIAIYKVAKATGIRIV